MWSMSDKFKKNSNKNSILNFENSKKKQNQINKWSSSKKKTPNSLISYLNLNQMSWTQSTSNISLKFHVFRRSLKTFIPNFNYCDVFCKSEIKFPWTLSCFWGKGQGKGLHIFEFSALWTLSLFFAFRRKIISRLGKISCHKIWIFAFVLKGISQVLIDELCQDSFFSIFISSLSLTVSTSSTLLAAVSSRPSLLDPL